MARIRGACLCGSVRYATERARGPMAHCHCAMCRKAHGAAFSTVLPVDRASFRWTRGEEHVRSYESSPGKHRCFCSRCGSQLVSHRDGDEETLLLRAGCIDDDPGLRPVAHGWVGSRAPWFEPSDALPRFERGFPGAPPGLEEA